MKRTIWWAAVVLAVGCNSDAKLGSGTGLLGDGVGGSGTDNPGGSGGATLLGAGGWGGYAGKPQGCEEQADPFAAVEVWTGYIQGVNQEYPGDRITLRFSSIDETSVAGEVVFGQGGNPGYMVPSDLPEPGTGGTRGAPSPVIREGFPFTSKERS